MRHSTPSRDNSRHTTPLLFLEAPFKVKPRFVRRRFVMSSRTCRPTDLDIIRELVILVSFATLRCGGFLDQMVRLHRCRSSVAHNRVISVTHDGRG